MSSRDNPPSANGRAADAAPTASPPGQGSPPQPSVPAIQPGGAGADETPWTRFLDGLVGFFTSMRLTVVCLALGMVVVFAGTMAQVEIGLYKAQNEFFRSFFVFWGPPGASWRIPVMPGGYLVGGVLLINLIASHFKRFRFSLDKAGIWLAHFGLILLLLGQLGTDLLSRESTVHLREGEAKNYSEAERQAELAVVDTTEADSDKVVAIPQGLLMDRRDIRSSDLPFTVRVKKFFVNSLVEQRPPEARDPSPATQGLGLRLTVKELPRITEMDRRDVPSAVVEIVTPQGQSLGSWLVSEYIGKPQGFTWNHRNYELALRPRRYYEPYSIQLLQFRHDVYPGTDIPKNFSSRVLLQRPDTGESREVLIYMNNPLRYVGQTYYQASYDEDNHGTVLQVVHNPSWLTPYFSCVLVGVGLIWQFATHLLGFTLKRKRA